MRRYPAGAIVAKECPEPARGSGIGPQPRRVGLTCGRTGCERSSVQLLAISRNTTPVTLELVNQMHDEKS